MDSRIAEDSFGNRGDFVGTEVYIIIDALFDSQRAPKDKGSLSNQNYK